MKSIIKQSHAYAAKNLRQGDVAIDATVGNGNDLLFLARAVGPSGTVFGFDIQRAAYLAARKLLTEAGITDRVRWIHDGHEHMADHMPSEDHGQVRSIMFNLGYLPGGDKSITTKPRTTIVALNQALSLIAPDGVIVVTVYPGHPGGRAESDAVAAWARSLSTAGHDVEELQDMNASNVAPWLLVVNRATS